MPRQKTASPRRAAAALLGAAALLLAGQEVSAAASTQTEPAAIDIGQIADTVTDMVEKLKSCLAEDGRTKTGVALNLPQTMPLERAQNINLLDVLDATLQEKIGAAAGGPEIRYVNLYAAQKQARADAEKKLLAATDVLIEPEVTTLGKTMSVKLQITRSNAAACPDFLSSRSVPIPQSILGEAFVEPRQLVSRFADAFWIDATRGRENVLHLAPDAAAQMRGFADQTAAELPKNIQKKNDECMCRPTRIEVKEPGELPSTSTPERLTWSLDLNRTNNVEWGADAVKVSMLASPLDGNPAGALSEDGLIEIDKLPQRVEVSSEDLQNLPPATRSGILKEVPADVDSTKNQETMGDRPLIYKFVLETESIVEIDLKTPEGTKIPYQLLNASGDVVEPDFTGKLRVNLTRYRLAEGRYFAKIEPSLDVKDFFFRFRRSSGQLISEAPGTLLKQYGDWLVGEQMVEGRKACFAYTSATDESVTNRLQRPILYFALREGTDDPLAHKADTIGFYNPDAPIIATIYGRGQQIARTELHPFSTGELAPMDVKNGQKMSSLSFQRGYTDGSVMQIEGKNPQNLDSRVVYSLRGYRFAVNAIAENCNRRDVYHILDFSQEIK